MKKDIKDYIRFLRFLNTTTYKIWSSYYFVILFKVFTENLQVFGYSYAFAKIVEILFKSAYFDPIIIYFWLVVMIIAWILDNLASNFIEIKRPVFYRKAQAYLIKKASITLRHIPYVYFETQKFQVDLKTFESLVIPKFLTATDLLPNFLKSGIVFLLSSLLFVLKYNVALLIILGVIIEIFMLRPAVFKYNQKKDDISYLARYVQYFSDQILGLVNFRTNKVYNLFSYLNKKVNFYYSKLTVLLYKLQKEYGYWRILAGNLGNFVGRFIPWIYYTIMAINKKISMDQYVFVFGLVSRVHNKTFVFMRVGLELYSISNYYDIFDAFVNGNYKLSNSILEKYFYNKVDHKQGYRGELVNTRQLKLPEIKSLVLKDVYFKYPGMKDWVLSNINLSFYNKRPYVITGPNGVGKTTLFYIIYGLFKPLKGNIFVNKKLLTSNNIKHYQKHIGYMLQQMPNLYLPFQDSVALLELANSGFKRSDDHIDIKRIKQSLKLACGVDILKKVRNNYNLILGKFFAEGIELSGGQWRKLSIARLFYYNPEVLLLDEPFVNIDIKSRIKILDNLLSLAIDNKKILIVISHLPEIIKGIKDAGGKVISL